MWNLLTFIMGYSDLTFGKISHILVEGLKLEIINMSVSFV